MTTRIGDRPRFPITNQRFDKGDAENIASYYEDIISRFTGSVYGQAWGCVSNPGFNLVTVALGGGNYERQLRFGTCALLHSTPSSGTLNSTSTDTGPWSAVVTVHDSSREAQPLQSLSLTAAAAQGQRPWVLFKRQETATALGNKAYWNTATNTEAIEAAPLQQSEYVQFKLSTSYSETQRLDGWYRMAYIDSFSGSGVNLTAVVVPIHWMDSQYYDDVLPPVQGTVVASAMAFPGFPGAVGTFGFDPSAEMPELAKLMHWTIGKLGQHFSTTNTVQVTAPFADTYKVKPGAFVANYTGDGGWLATPPRGLLELHNDLSTAEQDIIDLNNVDVSIVQSVNLFISQSLATNRLLHTLYVTRTDVNTYSAQLGSDVVYPASLAPPIVTGTSVPPDSEAYGIYYLFEDGVRSSSQKKVLLTLRCSQTTGGPNYIISAIQVVPHGIAGAPLSDTPQLTISQRYYTTAPNAVPPYRSVKVEFVIQDPNPFDPEWPDLERPFTVYIYGRNV